MMQDLHKDLVQDILEIYRAWDRHILGFQQATGMRCPPGCGICCESLSVEATVVECLPLADAISCQGQAQTTLAAIEESADQFYDFGDSTSGVNLGRIQQRSPSSAMK